MSCHGSWSKKDNKVAKILKDATRDVAENGFAHRFIRFHYINTLGWPFVEDIRG